ncbi:MAG: hypothetical protein FWG91_03920 [Lachnospiraceae bacterium]|nr:hypothetical protein [Lachnospiraceae bacterium]
MKKKIVKLFLGLVLSAAFLLSACSNGDSGGRAVADANGNFIPNGNFDDGDDLSPWVITNEITEEVDLYDRATDAISGSGSLHFYSPGTVDFLAVQELSGLEDGTYVLACFMQGDAAEHEIFLFAESGGTRFEVEGTLNGYVNWNNPSVDVTVSGGSITVGISVTTGPGGWGTIDDVTLIKKN